MELSHNDGIEDQHLSLKSDNWYWKLILDLRFKNINKIFEFRNTIISGIVHNIQMIREIMYDISAS
jgi:hypothetical protein